MTVGAGHLMLTGMPLPNALVRVAFVVTIALALVACTAARPILPPGPTLRPGPTPARSINPDAKYAYAIIGEVRERTSCPARCANLEVHGL